MLLSRVADSLYWASRYLERAEHTARLLEVHLNIALDSGAQEGGGRWQRLLDALQQETADDNLSDYEVMSLIAFDPQNPQSIVASIASARENARQIREAISSEMWTHLNGLYLSVSRSTLQSVWNTQPHEFFRMVKEGSHLFQGITDSTMAHGEGWQFIQLGRFLERAISSIELLDVQLRQHALKKPERLSMGEYFDWLSFLKCFTAFEAYCKIYTADLRADRIVNFLLFDPTFPHALHFCVDRIAEALDAIADSTALAKNSRLYRLVGRLRSRLSYDEIGEVIEDTHHYLEDLKGQISFIHTVVYETYIYRPIASSLSGGA